MELVEGLVDYGVAPEIYVDGVGKIERIAEGIVRVTLFTRVDGEKRVVCRLIWDRKTWMGLTPVVCAARAEVATAEPTHDVSGELRAH